MTPIVMELRGRLGNQLFCFATATAISKSLDLPVSFSARFADSNLDILSFDLDMNFVEPGRVLLAYQRSRIMRGFRKFTGCRDVVQESSYRFDESIFRVKRGQTLRGHFQSPRYFGHLRSELTSIFSRVRKPSASFMELSSQLGSEYWVAVQVRGGDYFSHQDKFTMPDRDYYRVALSEVHREGEGIVIVFTDDANHAHQMVPGADHYIVGGRDLSPAESLVLAKSATSMVGTNSTFSWWTGFLMQEQSTKVFPKKWFKHEKFTEEDLFPYDFLLLNNFPSEVYGG